MEGGINAWKGLVAKGAPDAGMAYFEPVKKTEELIALAWLLEEGSRKFYAEMTRREKDQEAVGLFSELLADEEGHKTSLFKLHQTLSGQKPDPGFPRSLINIEPGIEYLEGGMLLSEALEWVRGKEVRETLDLSISLEVNAVDLYIKMERKVKEKEARQVFQALSNQERKHLKRLSSLLEKR
ncbi:MAG: ferritin family protein [Thermodesulfobacteriota bacterium]|jgi:rubrerythrin